MHALFFMCNFCCVQCGKHCGGRSSALMIIMTIFDLISLSLSASLSTFSLRPNNAALTSMTNTFHVNPTRTLYAYAYMNKNALPRNAGTWQFLDSNNQAQVLSKSTYNGISQITAQTTITPLYIPASTANGGKTESFRSQFIAASTTKYTPTLEYSTTCEWLWQSWQAQAIMVD